jgi:hypothetical protein
MSFYNMLFGMNANLAVVVSPFLPRRTDHFPRFRNVFLEDDESVYEADIFVYTRMGGGNRECWAGYTEYEKDENGECTCPAHDAARLEADPNCVGRYDDSFDCTYCTFAFKIPDEWREDWELLQKGDYKGTSDRFKNRLKEMWADSEKVTQYLNQED